MIQRKQTLFLLGVLIIGITMLFIPFQSVTNISQITLLNLSPSIHFDGMNKNIYIPIVINFIVIILSILTIFLFKKRVLQYKLANILTLLNVFITGLFFLLDFFNVELEKVNFTFGAFLPLIAAIFSYLAAHFIKKDEELVRSADRIR